MFFITCCDKDNSIKQEDKLTQSKLNIQITSWSHLENSNNKIANEISIYKKSNLFKRDIRTSEHGFFIDDSKVQIIENSNFTTYTFFVFRENPESNILENYIYKAYNDGRHAQYLLKYHYSVDEENNKIYDTTVLDIEVIEDDNLIFSGASCVPEFTQVLDDIVCTSNTVCTGDGRHALGENCYCTPSPSTCDPAGSTSCELQYIWAYQGCGGGATGSYPDDNNNGNQTGGVGGTNGNNNDGEEEPTPAVPMELSVQDQILKCLNGFSSLGSTVTTFINPEIFESLNLSKFQWAEMNNYLQDNNCSEQAQQEVIDQLLEALENQCQANVQSQIAELTTQLGLSATTASCLASTNTDCLSVAALFNFSQNNPTETAFSKAAAETICNDGDVDYVNEILYYIDQKCAKKVVKSVLNNSSVLSQTILGYFSQDKDYIIKYKNDTLPLGIQGAVSPISSCVVKTKFKL